MKYLDEYRDATLARALADQIARRVTKQWVLMEICGGQTHTLLRYGLPELLPPQIELVHGPGCPVCVTPLAMIDKALAIAGQPGVILASYGDMLRVPGSKTDLLRMKAAGADVRIVYSPVDALKIARENPDRQVVLFAVGFETTAPANAVTVWQAQRDNIANFSLLASHVLVPPAMRLILGSKTNRVQGLIAPGHVCTITGMAPYDDLCRDYAVPIVVAGFEPVDLLEAILMLVDQLESGWAAVENQYARSVQQEGNAAAQALVGRVFEVCDQAWRGVGVICGSGLRIRDEYRAYDAETRFQLSAIQPREPAECIGAQVLQGLKRPYDCPAFGTRCTPETPLGAPMVSTEGACAAYYTYLPGMALQ